MASAWVLYQITGSPVLLGLHGLFLALPTFIFVPIAGAVADRLQARRVLLVTQVASLVNALVLGLLVGAGWVQPWHIYLQGFLQAFVNAFDVTARQAFFPRLIPREQLEQAVALNFSVVRGGMLAGPAIGGILIAEVGAASAYYLNAATYLFLLVAVLVIRVEPFSAPTRVKQSLRGDVLQGFTFVRQSPALSSLLLFAAVWAVLSYNPALLTIFASDVLQVGPEGLGLLLSAAAIGQLGGSIGLVLYGEVRQKSQVLLGITCVYAIAMLAFAFSRVLLLSAALLIAAGAANAIFAALRHAMLQRASPEHMRGRVMGTHILVTRGATPLSQFVSGGFVWLFGAPLALILLTVGLTGAGLKVLSGESSLRAVPSDDARSSVEPSR